MESMRSRELLLDELGAIPSKYDQLKEIEGDFTNQQDNYDTRTRLNIRDSDGTLILLPAIPIPSNIKDGTLLTIREVANQKRPYLVLDISANAEENALKLKEWLEENNISTLNIAGPRESNSNGIYNNCYQFLSEALLMPVERIICKL